MKQLLVDTQFFAPKPVTISEGKEIPNNGNLFVEGILSTVEVKNGNGRYYSRDLWDRELKEYQKKIDRHSTETCGELDHPESQTVNLKNASHAVRKLWWDGDNIMGLVEIFCADDKKGNIAGRTLASFFHNNLVVGISSRGLGSLKEGHDGTMEVQDDFSLVCWDFVSNPSNPGSWFKPKTLNESIQYVSNNKYANINRILTEILCANGTCPII